MSTNTLMPHSTQYFAGEIANENQNEYRTLPKLLREVADWMDKNDIADTEFQNLCVNTTFENLEDRHHLTVTVYHLPK